jgi:hypothetical protein
MNLQRYDNNTISSISRVEYLSFQPDPATKQRLKFIFRNKRREYGDNFQTQKGCRQRKTRQTPDAYNQKTNYFIRITTDNQFQKPKKS